MGQSNLIDESSSGQKEQFVCQTLSQPNGLRVSRRERVGTLLSRSVAREAVAALSHHGGP